MTARRQIDVYHVYTVDVHTLFAVRRLFALRCGDVQEERLSARSCSSVERPLALYLGTLFHDIGKGVGQGPLRARRGDRGGRPACASGSIPPTRRTSSGSSRSTCG